MELARAESPRGWQDPTQIKTEVPKPENLPARLVLPPNTTATILAGRVGDKPTAPNAQAEKDRLLWSPDLVSAVVRRDADAVHAEYLWEGEGRSAAYQIQGTSFVQGPLQYPNEIIVAQGAGGLSFYLGSHGMNKANSQGMFPGLDWYSPDTIAGTARLGGKEVFVFSASKTQFKASDLDLSKYGPDETVGPEIIAAREAARDKKGDPQMSSYVLVDPATSLPLQMFDGAFQYVISYAANSSPVVPAGVFKEKVDAQFAGKKKL